MLYSTEERSRTYGLTDIMRFSRGRFIMTPVDAERLSYGLVIKDRETGRYRRACYGPEEETGLINAAKLKGQLGGHMPSPWSSSRPR